MRYFGSVALAALAITCLAGVANAATCTAASTECSAFLDQISASNIGTGSQGTVTLTELTADSVLVEVSLTSGALFVNSGGPHTPFVYNLSSSLSGVSVTIDTTPPDQSNATPASFFVATGSQPATPYGTFTNGIGYNGSNGGGNGNAGPLYFTVSDTNGINLTDFIKNSDGYFFGADVLGTGGNTGSVAANGLTDVPSTPLPAALPMFAGGLGLIGLVSRRKKRKAKASVA